MLKQPNEIEKLPNGIQSNVMKSLVNLIKCLSRYGSFRSQLQSYCIKWSDGETSLDAFSKIVNNLHFTLDNCFEAMEILAEN